MTESPYLTIAQVCDLLQLSRSTVVRRLADKTFTRVRVGHSIRILRAEVESLATSKRRRS